MDISTSDDLLIILMTMELSNDGPKDAQLTDLDALAHAAECLKTLAHPIRLRIVQLLLRGEYTVGELAEACDVQSSVVSEHLGLMHDRGLFARERRGRRIYYRVAMPGIEGISECVRHNFGSELK